MTPCSSTGRDEAARIAVKEYIEVSNTGSISFGNARGIRNIFEKLMVEQANRLSAAGEVTKEQLMTITQADVLAARASDTQLAKAEMNRKLLEESTKNAISELEKLI